MRILIPAALVALLALISPVASGDPKVNELEDVLFPLPPREVAAGRFEKLQQEAARKPASVMSQVDGSGIADGAVLSTTRSSPPRGPKPNVTPEPPEPQVKPPRDETDKPSRRG